MHFKIFSTLLIFYSDDFLNMHRTHAQTHAIIYLHVLTNEYAHVYIQSEPFSCKENVLSQEYTYEQF